MIFIDLNTQKKWLKTYYNVLICNFNKIISENYLDLASGTGQVYFKVQSKFNGLRIAQDISEKQFQVLNQKMKNLNNEKCISILGDSFKIGQ